MDLILPFTISDDGHGLYEISGFAYLEDEFLVLEVSESFLGMGSKERDVVKVAPTAVESVETRVRFGRTRIALKPASLALLDAVPGAHKSGAVVLRVGRKHRTEAEALAAAWAARVEQARRLAAYS